jgi:hypothetical protein
MTEHELPLDRMLCVACSVVPLSVPLCTRCRALVDSGKCEGPRPAWTIARAVRPGDCFQCTPPKSTNTETFKICERHARVAEYRQEQQRRQSPRDSFDRPPPAVSHVVGHIIESIWVR